MDDFEDDARYPPKPYSIKHYTSSQRPKLPLYSRPTTSQYDVDNDDDDENDDQSDEPETHEYDLHDDDPNGYYPSIEQNEEFVRHPKKRKLKNSVSDYEFAPRVASPNVKLTFRGRVIDNNESWTEHETLLLLELWGDRFLELGRKSLRSEDWHEVAEKVSDVVKIEKTETDCRNRLDMLKKKYKKEKLKLEQMGLSNSKWVYFKKMDMLMASSPRQEYGLSCGVDSGEFVFMNTKVYLDRSNGFDEMRDSPGESETEEEEEAGNSARKVRIDDGALRLLADSVKKFGDIYEKIESSKREQMVELEKMRVEFHRELELQKKEILERAEAEIAKMQEDDDDDEDEDTDGSAENLSG